MKYYDCFCYFNEDLILELRLETLWPYVDFFVISEATFSHAGQQRELHFDPRRFVKYQSKIRYLPLRERPPGPNDPWRNENAIRNHVREGLLDAQPEDRILISDIDEIPRPAALLRYDGRFLRGDFKQEYYSYYFNNQRITLSHGRGAKDFRAAVHDGSKITTYAHFQNFFRGIASQVRIYKSSGLLRGLKREWFKRFKIQPLCAGGWHFTWIADVDGIVTKIESTAHQEHNRAEFKDRQHISAAIRQGRDFHVEDSRYRIRPLDQSFPAYLREHLEKFGPFIAPSDEPGHETE